MANIFFKTKIQATVLYKMNDNTIIASTVQKNQIF